MIADRIGISANAATVSSACPSGVDALADAATMIRSGEAEIAIAKAELGAEGLGCEPASAVTLAGLKRLRADGKVASTETVVLVLTGHTLKDADYTIGFHRGTLLTQKEIGARATEIEALRRDAVAVDATPEAVLAALKESAG